MQMIDKEYWNLTDKICSGSTMDVKNTKRL